MTFSVSCDLRTPAQGQGESRYPSSGKVVRVSTEGLGKKFVAEVDGALERIQANPEQYEIVHREIRHAILRRFPYGVFYRIREAKITVFAVLHPKRDDIPQKM